MGVRLTMFVVPLAALTACASAVVGEEADATESCDRLAAGPDDPYRRGEPVQFDGIEVTAALKACGTALTLDPDNPRLNYQHGRALLAAGQEEPARRAWRNAIVFDYEAALYDLARLYMTASPLLQSERATEAYGLLVRAAKRGHPAAAYAVGQAHEEGYGTYQSEVAAARWYAQAVAGGNVPAMRRLAVMYRDGGGVRPDTNRAIGLFEQAAVAGDADAMNALGWMYLNETTAGPDPNKSLIWFERAGASADAAGLYQLGRVHYLGAVGRDELDLAFKLWQRAAAQGSADAEYDLGIAYLEDGRIPRDEALPDDT